MRIFLLLPFFFLTNSFGQSWDWVQTIGLGGNNVVWDMTHDSQNNIITTGRVKFTVRFGLLPDGIVSGPIGSQTDAYIFKMTDQGDTLWARRMGGVDPDWSRGIAVDQFDNIYITGDFVNMAVFGNDTIYGYNNGSADPNLQARSGFIAKYDPAGNLIWVNKFQGGAFCRSYSIDVDNNGNSYITGMMSGITQFDAQTTGEANVTQLCFVAKYNANGICVWANYIDSPFNSVGNDIKIINNEKIVLTGYYKSVMVYNGNSFPGGSTSWGNFFLLEIDSSGSFIWNKTGTGSYNIAGNDIVIDGQENIYVVGHFAQSINFGTVSLVSIGTGTNTAQINANRDSFLAKYNVNGNMFWVNHIGNDTLTQFDAIELIDDSKVLIGGYTMDTIFVSNPVDTIIPFGGKPSTVVMAYDSAGTYLWNKTVNASGTGADNAIKSITVDKFRNIYCGGWYDEFGTWGTTTIQADNGYDAYIAKIFPPLGPKILGDSIICNSDTLVLTASRYGSPFTHSWVVQNGVVLSSTADSLILLTPALGVDTIRYIVTNGYETDTAILILNISVPPFIDLGADQGGCAGDIIVLDAGGPDFLYDWGSGFLINDTLYTVTSSGTYDVGIMDTAGCTNFDTINVLLADPVVNLGADDVLCSGDSLILVGGTQGFFYNWGSGFVLDDSTLTVFSNGSYSVVVMDQNNCIGSDSMNVVMSGCLSVNENTESTFKVIPNPFTNYLQIQFDPVSFDGQMIFSVYSITGDLVFRLENPGKNDLIDLTNLQPGVYFCAISDSGNISNLIKVVKIN